MAKLKTTDTPARNFVKPTTTPTTTNISVSTRSPGPSAPSSGGSGY